MHNTTETFGAHLSFPGPAHSAPSDLFRKSTTYLAKIAVVLQDAPCRMLTFAQLMDKLAPLICEDKKSVENNIRVCLSTNNCFVKIPVVPESLNSKRNYWKLDSSQITAKMVRRHFKGILQLFPELASKVERENLSRASPEPAAGKVKFTSCFSIENLLKRDSPSAQASSVPVRVEQQPQPTHRPAGTKRSFSWDSGEPLLLQTSAGSSPLCSAGGSTHHGATADGAAMAIKRMPVCVEPSFPVYTRAGAAPYFTSQQPSYITYSAPAFTRDALRFWL